MILLNMAFIAEAAEQGEAAAEATGFSDPRLWLVFSLIILVAVAIWKRVPALLTKALDERAEGIAGELDEARRLREEAQELLVSCERRQREVEKEAEAIIAQAKKEADLYAHEASENLQAVMQRRAEAAKRKIAQAEAGAIADVRRQAADLAVKTAIIALENNLTKTAQSKLLNASIKELGERLH